VDEFLEAAQALAAPLDTYFEKVFVMCEDEAVRRNRLAFLREVASLTKGFADLSQLPGF
jgi:glycyl-tRNA synthetase